MQMVVYDDMGCPQLVESMYRVGNDVTGVMPLTPRQSGPSGDFTNNSSLNDSANGLMELANLHNTLLVGNQLVASGTGDDKSAQNPIMSVRRPWLDAPEGAVPFDQQLAAVLGIPTTITDLVTLVVPNGYDGVITAYSWNFTGGGFVQGSGDIIVQVLRNGAAVRNYDNILVEKGSIAIPRPISPLRIYSGQTIVLRVNHAANALLNAGNIVGCFSGYFYPSMS